MLAISNYTAVSFAPKKYEQCAQSTVKIYNLFSLSVGMALITKQILLVLEK